MRTVAAEAPFAHVVYSQKLGITCSNCFAHLQKDPLQSRNQEELNLQTCSGCRRLFYCSQQCQIEDWRQHHRDECQFFVKSRFCPSEEVRMVSRMVMRLRKGDNPASFNRRTFDDLMDLADKFEEQARDNNSDHLTNFFVDLFKFMGSSLCPTQRESHILYGKYRLNAFPVCGDSTLMSDVGVALYVGLSVHNHSCRPDCVRLFIGTKMILKVFDPSSVYSPNLTVSYINNLRPRQYRKEILKTEYFFDCQCVRCVDEHDAALEKSAKCYHCPDGFVLPSETMPLLCGNCGEQSTLSIEDLDKNNNFLAYLQQYNQADEFDLLPKEIPKFMGLFDHMATVLSPYNLFMFQLATFVEIIAYRAYGLSKKVGYGVRRKCAYFELKCIERFAPFSSRHRSAVLDMAIFEKFGIRNMHLSMDQFARTYDSFRRAHYVIRECFNDNHPLTKRLREQESIHQQKMERLEQSPEAERQDLMMQMQ